MTTLGALIVLFHPSKEELAHAVSLRTHCSSMLAIDNSPQPDVEAAAVLGASGVPLLHNGNRNGIAGALNRGLAQLFVAGADAVVLFDQDSSPPPEFFDVMRDTCSTLGAQPFLLGPRIYDDNEKRFLPEIVIDGLLVRRLRLDPGTRAQRCSFLISSGCVVSRRAFETLGNFVESLFIDHVDTEYCFRALLHNVPLYVIPQLVLPHRIGNKRRHRLGPFMLTSENHAPTRRYYTARNAMYIALKYGMRFPVAFSPNLWTLWQALQVLLFEADKIAKLRSILMGVADGLFGQLGPLETARPGLAAWLAHRVGRE
ncbi:glycosyltransferase family 2 protein [Paraburkholderia sp.]|uniref:glycosyltransferase family 2 protein n=1 Tax=Paraburkholderia sp. TaxID=1926495 RepID=UPI003D6FF6C2